MKETNKKEAEMLDQEAKAIQKECRRILAENESSLQFRLAVDIICPDMANTPA